MKTLASKLQDWESYLHKNGLFVRTIVYVNEGDVEYTDWYNRGSCSKAHFARTCPTIATEEDKQREEDFNEKYYAWN